MPRRLQGNSLRLKQWIGERVIIPFPGSEADPNLKGNRLLPVISPMSLDLIQHQISAALSTKLSRRRSCFLAAHFLRSCSLPLR
jgi:hypothetical protein